MAAQSSQPEACRPQWIPDDGVDGCPHCGVSFSFFERRHHCRNCGRIFCAGCTSARAKIASLGYNNPVRVCGDCNEFICAKEACSISLNIDDSALSDPLEWESFLLKYGHVLTTDLNVGIYIAGEIPSVARRTLWKTAIFGKASSWSASKYQALLNPSAHDDAILMDLTRTFPNHPYFVENSGRSSLFNVLQAYAHFNPTIGYIQGMSFVAGVALMETSEEEAFWLLVELMGTHLQSLCVDAGVMHVMEQIQLTTPQLLQHLGIHRVFVDVFVHRWLTTLFTYDLPLPVVVQVWDLLLIFGPNFGIAFAIALLQTISGVLLKLNGDGLVRFFNIMQNNFVTPIKPLLIKAIKIYSYIVNPKK